VVVVREGHYVFFVGKVYYRYGWSSIYQKSSVRVNVIVKKKGRGRGSFPLER